ncbi:cytidylyltransferase domain-containing protein [Aliivibrio fischeri]|uniref:acylneuraminate cytidylyltransferase family protein n=1 Tax=Aliivibrio fischeri TaxID=668 RepID=UPI0012DACA5C|nr:acylneuraminate cytidylyltransferase family protein [Aliivibrio fischeri]MUK65317.1 hypothetical protein [Aliivibrio fischeri]
MLIYAVIPARSGSKGLPDKNIKEIDGKPLISYSIEFAKTIQSVDRVFCSTDSELYADIAKKYSAEVPFLRSENAAADTAMEQHILKDLRASFIKHGIPEPDIIVWLRPTFVFRAKDDIEKAIDKLVNNSELSSVRTIVESENRLYEIENEKLVAAFNDGGKSMIRRQDMNKGYKVFSTDIFRFKGNDFGEAFLGSNIHAIESHKICGLDIDDIIDFHIVKSLVENSKELVCDFLPKNS